jgi:hypothetical protein
VTADSQPEDKDGLSLLDHLGDGPFIISDGFDGPTIIYPDGTVVHYPVPTQDELEAAGPSSD